MDHDWDHGMGINGEFSIDLVQPIPTLVFGRLHRLRR